ncbi:MAG: hypothetical protein ABI472_04040 [Ginsengibacter sp.]
MKMMLVVPMNVKGPVTVLMMFGLPAFPAPAQPSPDDMETLNTTFKALMIQTNPALKDIFNKYPAYAPIARLSVNFFCATACWRCTAYRTTAGSPLGLSYL